MSEARCGDEARCREAARCGGEACHVENVHGDEPHLRRHDRAFVAPDAWAEFLQTRDDLRAEPLVPGWALRGWPLVVRRGAPGEAAGVALGLPLPPAAGKRRIALVMRSEDLVAVAPPLPLRDAVVVAPDAWKPTLAQIDGVARSYGSAAHVFGSLALQAATGLRYVRAESDLDLVVRVPRAGLLGHLLADLSAIQRAAPMRLDVEMVRSDGAAVHWLELRDGPGQVLAKSLRGVALLSIKGFLGDAWAGAGLLSCNPIIDTLRSR